MTTFFLIRHGTTDMVGKAIAGWLPDVHLNAEGRRQAEQLAGALAQTKFDRLISSPLDRTRETAKPLSARVGLPVEIVEAIGEVRFGNWTGRTLKELDADPEWQRWNSFRTGSKIPNGETMLEVQSRFVGFIQQLARESEGRTIALFSHGDPIRSVVLYYLGMPMDFYNRIEISPASLTVLCLNRHGAQFLRINQVLSS